MRPATRAVHAGRPARESDQPLNPPITAASTYVSGGALEYGRYQNPTWTALEEALGSLEGGSCLTYASGMAAITTLLDLVGSGERVVAPRHAYTGTVALLADLEARGRLSTQLVDITDLEAVAEACEDAALVWLESPTNPALEVADIAAIAEIAHRAGAQLVVDNTFATPILQQPLDLGADVVVHSVTKYIGGHSDLLLGAVVTRDAELLGVLRSRRDLQGAVPGAFEAWLALRGLRTLPLRVERAQSTAAELAGRLRGHSAVTEVRYPGFGGILAFVLPDADRADLVVSATRLWVPATSLGGVESSLERRRRWRLEPTTIPAGLIRASVGLEDVEDLWEDLRAALDPVG